MCHMHAFNFEVIMIGKVASRERCTVHLTNGHCSMQIT